MPFRRNFRRDVHSRFGFDTLQPPQALDADSFESAGFRAGLPDSGAENPYPVCGKIAGCRHYLFFGLGTARAGYHERPFLRSAE